MVFKPFTHLARQSFAKTLTHGYAQSVVAATQSSYASSTTPFSPFGNHHTSRFGKSGSVQLHNAFHNASNSASVANITGQPTHGADSVDVGLAAYYEAWQNQQQRGEGQEWKQFQFTKRIGWKPPTIVLEGKGIEKEEIDLRSDIRLGHGALDRSYSASAVDDIKKAENDVAEAVAVANVDEAIAEEIRRIQLSAAPRKEEQSGFVSDIHVQNTKQPVVDLGKSDSPSPFSAGATIAFDQSTRLSDTATSTSTSDVDSEVFSDYIDKLNKSQLFSEIPPVFESMLIKGIRPSIKAYNALLAAAIHLPHAQHQAVPKALDVYSDMLRRKLLPDTPFYTTLIQLLSRRALEVFRMKASMDKRRSRFGGLRETGQFLFRSNEAEYDILTEDDALTNAVKIFDSSVSMQRSRIYSPETYQLLVTACAIHNRLDDMIRAYSHMEDNRVTPIASMYPPMIAAFGASGDLNSAVECYNEYKSLAIADDAGEIAIIDRKDTEVYAAVIKAYTANGHEAGGHRFLAKIVDSFDTVTENRMERLEAVQDVVVLEAVIQEHLDAGNLLDAFSSAQERSLSPSVRSEAMSRICSTSADQNDFDLANKSYQHIIPASAEASSAELSMLALHVRQGNAERARESWGVLTASPESETLTVESTAMYAIALIGSGNTDEGLMQARQAFARIRAYPKFTNSGSEIAEEIDESIELIGSFLADNGIVPSPQGTMTFLRAMVENGGLVSPVAEQLLAGLRADNVSSLSWQDLTMALQIEAEIVGDGKAIYDVAHSSRFAYLLDNVMDDGIVLDKRTLDLIERALEKIASQRPDLLDSWQKYLLAVVQLAYTPAPYVPKAGPALVTGNTYADSFDPYAATTDHKGSAVITDELDSHKAKAKAGLNEALLRFRNMRRAGRHPRYIVYAKLISSAAKEGRTNLMFDILDMARQDVPFLSQYPAVRHGWSAILDAMVGACLTVGNRIFAAQFHQELLDIGAAPTANTFGLYITTLKDSTRTFDEATEAVKIFHRAKSEGVEPSSFLYNALIGKLGKARRIDDCLYYFAEMRALGIRPTSVTYGTIVNALCRVSDERFAEELFDEMESMSNYKPRPAPYNSLMQFFLTTKRDREKVLAYYDRMLLKRIQPTMHTYKLLIDTYATLTPVDLAAAEGVLDTIRALGQRPEAVHFASLIHAKGCALHDIAGARQVFDAVLQNGEVRPQACLYQALFESMVANHCVNDTEKVLDDMSANRVEMTPYIANTLIHGWAMEKNIARSNAVYESVGMEKREPSTYEAMTRAFLTVEDRDSASKTVKEMMSRGYPSAVAGKILDLLGHGMSRVNSDIPPESTVEIF